MILRLIKLCNDPLQAEIRSPNNTRLDFTIEIGKMTSNMAGSQGNHKKTCNGIVSLCQHFLATSHKYVQLKQFSTDPFVKEIGKLRQRSGSTYFINVQQCIEKLHIKKTSLLLNQNVNIDEFDVNAGHQCTSCDYKLCEEGSEIFDHLKNFEPSLSNEIKMALVYIAGYITKNDYQPCECKTHF